MIRRLLLMLALSWGILVFIIEYVGVPRLTGDIFLINLDVNFRRVVYAAFAALPLFIGALVANAKTGWRLFLRSVCVVLLARQTMHLFGFIWFNPLVLPPFLGAYLLLPRLPLSRRQWWHRAILGFVVFGLMVFYQSTKYICYPERRIISDKEHLESFIDEMLKSGNVKLHGWDNTVESYLATHPKCCKVSSNAFWNNLEFDADVVVTMTYEMSEQEKARGGYSNDTHYEYLAFLSSCGREYRSTGMSFTPTTTLNH